MTSSALPVWAELHSHRHDLIGTRIADLFAGNPNRGPEMTIEDDGLVFDYSKNLVTTSTMNLLVRLAEQRRLTDGIEAMFAGDHVNVTEDRAALHTALRAPADDCDPVSRDVQRVLRRMGDFATRLRSGTWLGVTGKPIRVVVNIGIGGSDLGPAMAYQSLREFAIPTIDLRFVSNVDGHDLTRVLD